LRRIDDLGDGLKLIQETNHFCFGTDSVALANFAGDNSFIKEETKIIDFGCGNGVIPILLAGKTPSNNILGIEIQKEVASLAQENVQFNNLQDRIKIINADIIQIIGDATPKQYSSPSLTTNYYPLTTDIITCNPPYKPNNSGLKSTNPFQNIARNEITITISQIIEKAYEFLKEKGRFFMVLKPERLAEVITLMSKNNLEPKCLQMVYHSFEKPPCLVLIESVKDAQSGLTIKPPLKL